MTGLEAIEIIRDRLIEYKNKAEGTNIKCLISPQFAQVRTELKALEIIKEKYPNVVEVKLCKNYEHYKLRMSGKHDTEIVKIDWNDKSLLDYLLLLTEEEFNTLKEVLE